MQEIPETITSQDLFKLISAIKESTSYLAKAVENNFEDINEFNLIIESRDTITQENFNQLFQDLESNFARVWSKVEESFLDTMSNISMHVKNQVIKLNSILDAINTNIRNNQTIVNKKDILQDIKNLRTQLFLIQKEMTLIGNNPEVITKIYQSNKVLINYLKEAQENKFRQWSLINLAEEINRTQDLQINSIEELMAHILATNKELENLAKQAEKIDLTITNKTARFIDDYIVTPTQKHDLHLYGLTALVTAGLGTYGAYYFDEKFFTNPSSIFRKWFGFPDKLEEMRPGIIQGDGPPHLIRRVINAIPNAREQIENALPLPALGTKEDHIIRMQEIKIAEAWLSQLKTGIAMPKIPLAKMESFIYRHKTGAAAIGIGLLGLASYCYYKIWKNNKDRWESKLKYWFNKAKGGSFAKTAEKYDFIYPTTTFDDVIGLEYEKSLVYPHLKYIKDPERWDANELTPPTGILLTGPTRSGKTFFAKAICGELHKQNPDKTIRFIPIDAHDIKERGIAWWMEMAKIVAPCVLFIDEIDLLGLQRTQDKTLLADFLQSLSGISDKDPKKQVIVIGTTNKPENIDTAMLQSGRLALEIRFKYPNMQERKHFITKRLEKFAIDPEMFEIDIDKLARETQDKSFEDIKLMIDTAFIHVGIKGQIISQQILEWALDNQLRKIVDLEQKQISASEKRLLAAHYAGQVLTQLLLGMDEKVSKVTIRQIVTKVKEENVYEQYYTNKQTGLEQGAVFTYLDNDTFDVKSQDELAKKAKTLLGARIAERLITGSYSAYFGWKKNSAFNMIKSLVADGIDFKSLSKSGQNMISDQSQERLKTFEADIEQLLLNHKDTLVALTDALQDKQTLSINQIIQVINQIENKVDQNLVAQTA